MIVNRLLYFERKRSDQTQRGTFKHPLEQNAERLSIFWKPFPLLRASIHDQGLYSRLEVDVLRLEREMEEERDDETEQTDVVKLH